jgi:hypothetical protein
MTEFQRYILRLLAEGWHIQDEPSAPSDVRYDLRGTVAPVHEVQPLIEQGYIAEQGREGRYTVYGLTDKGREALAVDDDE